MFAARVQEKGERVKDTVQRHYSSTAIKCGSSYFKWQTLVCVRRSGTLVSWHRVINVKKTLHLQLACWREKHLQVRRWSLIPTWRKRGVISQPSEEKKRFWLDPFRRSGTWRTKDETLVDRSSAHRITQDDVEMSLRKSWFVLLVRTKHSSSLPPSGLLNVLAQFEAQTWLNLRNFIKSDPYKAIQYLFFCTFLSPGFPPRPQESDQTVLISFWELQGRRSHAETVWVFVGLTYAARWTCILLSDECL